MKKSWLRRDTTQLKRTPLRRMGKQGIINREANKRLAEIYREKGITECEICGSEWGLSWHHKHRRNYYKNVEGLSDFNETILLCIKCHNKYKPDSEETIDLFNKFRLCQKEFINTNPNKDSKRDINVLPP